jgi:hypothetical protein
MAVEWCEFRQTSNDSLGIRQTMRAGGGWQQQERQQGRRGGVGEVPVDGKRIKGVRD